jgi:hypothetical protein
VKPFSEACERNKAPILEVLGEARADRTKVLEVGSGTGQHAVHLASGLPHLIWQPSDLPQHLPGMRLWLEEAGLDNLLPPLALDISQNPWPATQTDAVFTANTLHIVPWRLVQTFFERVGACLPSGGVLVVYGPFSYGGVHTSESNARFDLMLRERDPRSGVRDFEAINALAGGNGLTLVRDQAMPANNRTIVWLKR